MINALEQDAENSIMLTYFVFTSITCDLFLWQKLTLQISNIDRHTAWQ
jgi:hypothetical protein